MATWLLPENIADVLPREARVLERMRRDCVDLFTVHGFELVEPPLIEFVDSLLTGSGSDLDANTFKFTDQANGKMVGLRADFTPQIARIDAHILNRGGVARLCYAGNCLHARPMHPLASREPFVVGAELFGIEGEAADAEVMCLAVKTLRRLSVSRIHLDIGHTGVLRSILAQEAPSPVEVKALVRAMRMKDPVAIQAACASFRPEAKIALEALATCFGDVSVLERLRAALMAFPDAVKAIDEVQALCTLVPADDIGVDFCDVHGYRYLTGVTFSVHVRGLSQPVLRGGRYDGIGRAFGRNRPACGFSIYLRSLISTDSLETCPEAILAAGPVEPAYEAEVERLRNAGHIVLRLLPQEQFLEEAASFHVTQELVCCADGFEIRNI